MSAIVAKIHYSWLAIQDYRVVDDVVYIDRIIYGRRDYLKILFGSMLEDDTNQK